MPFCLYAEVEEVEGVAGEEALLTHRAGGAAVLGPPWYLEDLGGSGRVQAAGKLSVALQDAFPPPHSFFGGRGAGGGVLRVRGPPVGLLVGAAGVNCVAPRGRTPLTLGLQDALLGHLGRGLAEGRSRRRAGGVHVGDVHEGVTNLRSCDAQQGGAVTREEERVEALLRLQDPLVLLHVGVCRRRHVLLRRPPEAAGSSSSSCLITLPVDASS